MGLKAWFHSLPRYGKIKGLAFRLSNMGDETEETMGDLITKLDESMKEMD